MPHLLRYRELAVEHYSGIPCALHLWHARQSLNLGFVHSFLTVRRSPGMLSDNLFVKEMHYVHQYVQ